MPISFMPCVANHLLFIDHSTTAIMFENRRVYLLTGVAYMGAMLFGPSII